MIDIKNNTVEASNQMVNASSVLSYLGDPTAPVKILVLGNSITRHGPKPAIGWNVDWGMAASAPERDYVHRLFAKLCEAGQNVYMMIRQASGWEIGYDNNDILQSFEKERAFDADIVIYRLGENVKREMKPRFCEKLGALIPYVCPNGRVVFTTCFWKNEIVDDGIRDLAMARGERCVEITCQSEAQTAIGQFEHKGVAMHPSDAGMEMIADGIFAAVMAELQG